MAEKPVAPKNEKITKDEKPIMPQKPNPPVNVKITESRKQK